MKRLETKYEEYYTNKYEPKLKLRDDKIEFLLDRLDKYENNMFILANKDTTTVVNNGGNKITQYLNQHQMLNLDPAHINHQIEQNFTKQHFLNGTQGVVQFTIDYIITDESGNNLYISSDPSRNIFRFRTEDGIARDVNGNQLIKELHPSLMRFIHDNIFSVEKLKSGEFDHLDETTIEKFCNKLLEIRSISKSPDTFIKVLTPSVVS